MSSDNQNLQIENPQSGLKNSYPGVRRSHRPRIPNNIYTQDITESKRGLNLKDSKKKISRVYESEESLQSSKRVQNGSNKQDETQWIKCLIPNDQGARKQLYVQIVQPKNVKRNHNQFCENKALYNKCQQSFPNEIPKKMKKKASSNGGMQKSGLLDLLYEAAHKVANQDSEIQEPKKTTHYEEPEVTSNDKAPINASKKQNKEPKDDRQGKILRTYVQDEKLIFEHSKRGNIEIPFDRKQEIIKETTNSMEPDNESLQKGINLSQVKVKFDEYKRKNYNSLILI